MSEIVFTTEREQFRGGTTAFVVAPAAALADGSAFELAKSGENDHSAMLAAAAALAAKAGGGSVSGSAASTLVVGGDDDATELVLVPLPNSRICQTFVRWSATQRDPATARGARACCEARSRRSPPG